METLATSSSVSSNVDKDVNQTDHKLHPPPYEINVLFEFVVPGILLNLIGLLGLLGNVLSIIILSRPQMKSSIHCLLLGLASYDTILLLTSILMFGLPAVYTYTQQRFFEYYFFEIFPYITPFVYPVGMISQTGSVYLTLCVSVERYVAVCLPLKARSICTFGRARFYVIIIGVFSFLYNITRFREVTWHTSYYADIGANVTAVMPTALRDNPTYISVYITWLYLVVMYIVPFTCLAAFNLLIYHQVRRANSERARLTRLQKKEIGLATMLMVVVFVFFVCNLLALVVNILEVMNINIVALNNMSNLLVTLNSSVNFIIYCIFGEKFKKVFCRIFCPCLRKNQHHNDFVQRYPEGGALVAAIDRGPPKRRRSTSDLAACWSKLPSARGRADTLTTHAQAVSRAPSYLAESRVDFPNCPRRTDPSQPSTRRCRITVNDADDDYDDDDSGREMELEDGPFIREKLVSASSIPVFLSSRPNFRNSKDGSSRQHSLYIPKHDISITVNINTCSSSNNNNSSESRHNLISTEFETKTSKSQQPQQRTQQPQLLQVVLDKDNNHAQRQSLQQQQQLQEKWAAQQLLHEQQPLQQRSQQEQQLSLQEQQLSLHEQHLDESKAKHQHHYDDKQQHKQQQQQDVHHSETQQQIEQKICHSQKMNGTTEKNCKQHQNQNQRHHDDEEEGELVDQEQQQRPHHRLDEESKSLLGRLLPDATPAAKTITSTTTTLTKMYNDSNGQSRDVISCDVASEVDRDRKTEASVKPRNAGDEVSRPDACTTPPNFTDDEKETLLLSETA